MALEVLFYGGYIDGDRQLDSAVADYVAGMPCELKTDGTLKLHTSATHANYAGLFKNDKVEDKKGGPQAADVVQTTDYDTGRVVGTNMVRMTPGIKPDGSVLAPFVFPATANGAWQAGDNIFVNASGLWDNQATGGSEPRGRVIVAPTSATDQLIVDMYG